MPSEIKVQYVGDRSNNDTKWMVWSGSSGFGHENKANAKAEAFQMGKSQNAKVVVENKNGGVSETRDYTDNGGNGGGGRRGGSIGDMLGF